MGEHGDVVSPFDQMKPVIANEGCHGLFNGCGPGHLLVQFGTSVLTFRHALCSFFTSSVSAPSISQMTFTASNQSMMRSSVTVELYAARTGPDATAGQRIGAHEERRRITVVPHRVMQHLEFTSVQYAMRSRIGNNNGLASTMT